ncbi:MAG: UDP-N-acetylglucosamine--N-acetylmuramyl-(pentapeptide) pyrophosphoryl-undecaprenol N-acetylglucosamine transferase [Candidatus Parcubacteria bacterium]|nr:MAG: UDP-N-acetylglucosamine--N-acetylmuramyl-(pentapeptide) pyrophosphoryl-undecaprenol N-acetylglucosamine transferase [Candidatus Parcubacteria bacterium]
MVNKKEEIRICLTGGSTAGHFLPLVFVAQEIRSLLKDSYSPVKIFYLGCRPLKPEVFSQEDISIFILPSVKLRKYFDIKNFVDLLKMPFSFFIAFYYLFKLMPNVVFSKGGPGTLEVVIAAWLLRIPILIHDSDALPGLSNFLASPFATKIALAFESAANHFKFGKKRIFIAGQPIDRSIVREPILLTDYQRFGLDPERKLIVVMGGSQGSKFLNDLIVKTLPELLNFSQVVHLTGDKFYQDTYLYAKGLVGQFDANKFSYYHPFPYLKHDDLIYLMKMANLIISRAGSGTIFELASLGKPSILIPLDEKTAGLHQIKNAEIYAAYGAAEVLEEKNAKPTILLTLIKDLLSDASRLEKMHNAALSFSKLDAGKIIASEIIKIMIK